MHEPKKLSTWMKSGLDGTPPYFSVKFLPQVANEADFLTAQQYWHVADQIRDLANSKEPTKCATLNIAKIEDYWELKDKGGPLGKINLRVFFDIHEKNIIILGVHKKEDEGQLRKSVKVRISRRKRLYFKGMEAN